MGVRLSTSGTPQGRRGHHGVRSDSCRQRPQLFRNCTGFPIVPGRVMPTLRRSVPTSSPRSLPRRAVYEMTTSLVKKSALCAACRPYVDLPRQTQPAAGNACDATSCHRRHGWLPVDVGRKSSGASAGSRDHAGQWRSVQVSLLTSIRPTSGVSVHCAGPRHLSGTKSAEALRRLASEDEGLSGREPARTTAATPA